MNYQLTDNHLSGIMELDNLHQKAINALNRLLNSCDSSFECNEAFFKFQSALEKHFKYEQELMQQYNYPSAEEHNSQHARIRKSLAFLREQTRQLGSVASVSLADNIAQSVANPFMSHIRSSDKELAAFIRSCAGK